MVQKVAGYVFYYISLLVFFFCSFYGNPTNPAQVKE